MKVRKLSSGCSRMGRGPLPDPSPVTTYRNGLQPIVEPHINKRADLSVGPCRWIRPQAESLWPDARRARRPSVNSGRKAKGAALESMKVDTAKPCLSEAEAARRPISHRWENLCVQVRHDPLRPAGPHPTAPISVRRIIPLALSVATNLADYLFDDYGRHWHHRCVLRRPTWRLNSINPGPALLSFYDEKIFRS